MITIVVEVVIAVVVIFGLMAPLETLRWWSNRYPIPALNAPEVHPVPGIRRFAVYLSGIEVLDGDQHSRSERATLDLVRQHLPDVIITEDVFPYAMENRGLPQRATAWLWRRIDKARRRIRWWPSAMLISLRNVMQVLTSADPRYGETYSFGMASVMWRSLINAGYDPANPAPVTVIGYSGGAQIALGAARYLAAQGLNVDVISIGGVYADDPALDHIGKLTHLSGSRDLTQHLAIAFPGRWFTAPASYYGRAKRDGKIQVVQLGAMKHSEYFSRRRTLVDGRSYREATAAALIAALSD